VRVLTLEVPGRPVPKGRPRHTKRGHTYTPAQTAQAESVIRTLARAQGWTPLTGRLSVALVFRTDTRRGDVDNLAKLVLDALNGVAWVDDRQIDDLDVSRSYSAQSMTRIRIAEIEEWPKRSRKRTAGGGQ
jgi:crossover junction endodeoxyribonuclease RusA